MEDMMLYVLVGLFLLFILYTLMRNRDEYTTNPNNRDYRQRGSERPRYDDPNIRGRGNFGRPDANTNDDLEWLRRNRSSGAGSSTSRRPTNDSPTIRGRGSFGKDKS